jgi:hypothetical protein
MSEEERSATVRKLLKKAHQTDGMSFEMFTNWFVKTNRQISQFRAYQVSSRCSDSHLQRIFAPYGALTAAPCSWPYSAPSAAAAPQLQRHCVLCCHLYRHCTLPTVVSWQCFACPSQHSSALQVQHRVPECALHRSAKTTRSNRCSIRQARPSACH